MRNPKQRKEIAMLIERRRRELNDRTDVPSRVEELSRSGSRNLLGPKPAKRSTTLTVILATAAVLGMLVCAVSAAAVVAGSLWAQNQLNDPDTTAQNFYSALHQRNYAEAYSYFSTNAKAHLSESTFTDRYSSYDQINGVVINYPVTNTVVNGSVATITVAVVRRGSDSVAQMETLRMVKEGNDWRIDAVTMGTTVPFSTPTS